MVVVIAHQHTRLNIDIAQRSTVISNPPGCHGTTRLNQTVLPSVPLNHMYSSIYQPPAALAVILTTLELLPNGFALNPISRTGISYSRRTAQFEVQKDILAANSAIFRDIFANAQVQEGELVDGCPVVDLADPGQAAVFGACFGSLSHGDMRYILLLRYRSAHPIISLSLLDARLTSSRLPSYSPAFLSYPRSPPAYLPEAPPDSA